MPSLFDDWLVGENPDNQLPDFWIYREREGTREAARLVLREIVRDHLVGLEIIERMGGYTGAAAFLRNRFPTDIRIRSGDIGEVLATEYVTQKTDYLIPIKRLRYKDDRDTPMRGDDFIGIRRNDETCSVLKGEAKSRNSLSSTTVGEASNALMKHSARPNPSTLAFISHRLRESENDELAEVLETLQTNGMTDNEVEHLVFTFSGNDLHDRPKGGDHQLLQFVFAVWRGREPEHILCGKLSHNREKGACRNVMAFVDDDATECIPDLCEIPPHKCPLRSERDVSANFPFVVANEADVTLLQIAVIFDPFLPLLQKFLRVHDDKCRQSSLTHVRDPNHGLA